MASTCPDVVRLAVVDAGVPWGPSICEYTWESLPMEKLSPKAATGTSAEIEDVLLTVMFVAVAETREPTGM
jgi:hypothetical protein